MNNIMFAYYNQTFDLILPITDRCILCIYSSYEPMILKYVRYHTIKWR